jgi:hypothetical protein
LAITDDLERDSMGACTPPPGDVFERSRPFARRIAGEVFYVGLDPREYAYDVVSREGAFEVEVRVQLTGALASDAGVVLTVQRKMDLAAHLWTTHAPGHIARFRFVAVTGDETWPHFQVRLSEGDARTPYDVSWGTEWSAHLLAHEIGHMMGLDDEYGQLKKTVGHALGQEAVWKTQPAEKVDWFHCDPTSVMCDSKGEASVPLPYHYYVILRRRFCRASTPDDVVSP